MLEYKGYHAKIVYDDDSLSLFGNLYGIRDLVTFESDSPVEIVKEFHAAVDDYLESCKLSGKEPDRELSGKLNIVVTPEVHRSLEAAAKDSGKSFNKFVEKILTDYLAKTA